MGFFSTYITFKRNCLIVVRLLSFKLFCPPKESSLWCYSETVEKQNEALFWHILLCAHPFPTNHWSSWLLELREENHFHWTIAPPNSLIIYVFKIQRNILFLLMKRIINLIWSDISYILVTKKRSLKDSIEIMGNGRRHHPFCK